MNRIRHNYPSLIRCLRFFHILVLAYLLFRCYCYNHYKIPKTLLLLSLLLLPLPPLSYYFGTKHFAADTKFSGVLELTTQLLILENILWLPLCRINKFGLNTLPSKTVAIPYTCGLSVAWLHGYKRLERMKLLKLIVLMKVMMKILPLDMNWLLCLRVMLWMKKLLETS